MESPVMTSASSHRLRSAVSACAQPTHSYLSSSYLNASVQVESHNSGGCLKKFSYSGKNGEESLLNITKKSHSTSDLSPLHKKHKISNKHGPHRRKTKKNGKEVENSSKNDVLSLIPKQVMLGNDFLSKLKFNGKLLETKRLADYLDNAPKNDSVNNNCEKVINGKNINNKKIVNGNNKVLNNRYNNCSEGKGRKIKKTGKKDSIDEESECSDEWSKFGVVHLEGGIGEELSKWQPKHVVTRRTAQIVREIKNAWHGGLGSSSKSMPQKHVKILKDLLPLSPSEVSKMLEHPGKPSVNSVGFGHLDKIPNDDSRYRSTRSSSARRNLEKNDEKRKEGRKISKGMNEYKVFLGGSCNPTTWRTDFAIPELEKMAITYYNPQQVEEWRPELMEVEYHAKENASVMFFVLDNQTRGVSALIEVAHLAGNRRELILVIQSYTQKNQTICDEQISKEEYEDLKKGQEVLQVLVERQGIPVFSNIKEALESTVKILTENLRVQDLQASVPVNREISISPRDVFDKLDTEGLGEISASDVCLALKMLTGVGVSVGELKDFISKTEKKMNGTFLPNVTFDFELFTELVAEFKKQIEGGILLNSPYLSTSCYKDVYLGGTIENTSWRESIAIPALEKENLSYFVPKINETGSRFPEVEAAAMDNSLVLLFVITNTSRSIAAMAIAGHYIGKGAEVVLCVEQLPENAIISGEKLSENAVKDYNRGRMYLTDIAKRNEVQVLNDILTAVKFVIQKCRSKRLV